MNGGIAHPLSTVYAGNRAPVKGGGEAAVHVTLDRRTVFCYTGILSAK